MAPLIDSVKPWREDERVPTAATASTAPDDLRATLVRAARAELGEGGAGAVSLRAVARRAGVSHAAPGYAFGDRAGLLTAVAVQGFTELAQVMEEPPVSPGREGLAELGRRYVAFAGEHPALYSLMFSPVDLVADDADLRAARAASLRALTRVSGTDGRDAAPGPATLISWAFAHGVASLTAGGSLPAQGVRDLIDGFAGFVHPA